MYDRMQMNKLAVISWDEVDKLKWSTTKENCVQIKLCRTAVEISPNICFKAEDKVSFFS